MKNIKLDNTIEDLADLYKDEQLLEFPKIYYAYRKIREKWQKSSAIDKKEVIALITESIKEIEKNVRKEYTIDRERYRARKNNERDTDFVYSPSHDVNGGE